jgi:hypothetical protein
MNLSSNLKSRISISLMMATPFLFAACGGGGGSGTDAATPPSAPPITDNVLFSITPGLGVVATINKAGYLRAYDMSAGQPVTIALGGAPMTGSATAATGNGWLLPSGIFASGTVSLTSNPGATTYTLTAQSTSGQVSNSTMQLASNLQTPTLSALAGSYATGPYYTMVVSGSSFTGNYGFACTWSGTLSPNGNTIDVTGIEFDSVAGQSCSYAGKAFSGTAYLLGPSAAYAKGAIDIIFDDGGATMPTSINLYNFIRQ